jgi:ABC-type branched-subunit amino acid transport system substrate-binding protein
VTGASAQAITVTPAVAAKDAAAANPVDPTVAKLPVSGGELTLLADSSVSPFDEQNQLIRDGIAAALDVLNSHGGVAHTSVRLVSEALDGLSPAAVEARVRAAGSNVVLVLPCDSNSQASIAQGAATYATLMLAPCDADPSLARRLSTYWPVGMSGSDEASGFFVVNATGLRFATTMTRYFESDLRTAGIQVVGSASVPGAAISNAALASVVAAVKASHPATLFTALGPPEADALAAALAKAGEQQVYIFGTSALDTPETLSSVGSSSLQGATFPSYGFERLNSQAAAFAQDFKQRFGQDPVGAFPGLGFETVGLLELAIAKGRSTQPPALNAALLGGVKDAGVALFGRTYTSPSDHNPVTTVSIEKDNAGAFLPLSTTGPDGGQPPPP